MELDTTQIESLLAEKRYAEAKKLIQAEIAQKMADAEKGQALIGLASVYLSVSNAISEQYADALREAVASMKLIRSAQTKDAEKRRVAELKASLSA